MEFSNSYRESIHRSLEYYTTSICNYDYAHINTIDLSHKIILNTSNDTFEVPVACRPFIANLKSEVDNVVISNIVRNVDFVEIKGLETIIKKLSRETHSRLFYKFKYKTYKYYGACGWFLDENLETLFLTTTDAHRVNNQYRLSLEGYTLYINPKVFINQDDPLCKHIVKKILPLYLIDEFNVSCFTSRVKPKIVIQDKGADYIFKVNKPKNVENFEADVKSIFTNCDDIISAYLK